MQGRPLLAITLAALTMAGCVSTTAGIDRASIAGAAFAFAPSLAMEQDSFGAEPNIAIAPDGTIWITAVAGSQERPNHEQGAAWLWRSTDGGATFETLRAPARDTQLGSLPQTRRPFGSSDADVITSPDGWVYYSDWWNWGSPVIVGAPGVSVQAPLPVSPNGRYGSYLVERSSDGGATWESTSITTLDSLGGIDRQWLVAGPDGFVGLFYAYFHGTNPGRLPDMSAAGESLSSIQAVYSNDHGATWSKPATVVAAGNDEGFSQIGHPRLSPDGTLWMPHAYTANGETYWTDPGEVRVAISHDFGGTWDVVKVADVPGGFDNLWATQGDVDASGVMHVAWAARDPENSKLMGVYHAQSADGGATWSAAEQVSAPGLGFLPWVAARGDGEVAISYYYADAWGEPTEMPDEVPWNAVVAHRAGPGAPWTLANESATPVKTGPVCPRGASCAGNRELLDYSSVAFAADGRLHASFANSAEVNGVKIGLVNYAARMG